MEDSRDFHFTGNLDPRAQEFVPLNPISSGYYFPYSPLPPPLPPSSYGLSPTEPRVFTFFNLPPHPMIFPPPPPRPPPPRPYFHGVSAVQRLPPPSNSPTRSLSLISVPRDVTETSVRRDLELFGNVRGVQMERISQGIVTVHFYDLRHAKRAVREICARHMQRQARLGGGGGSVSVWSSPSSQARGFVSGRAVWAHFVVPDTSAVPGGCNQGTLVIFNLDPEVSSIALRQTFHVYGTIKELRETPYKKNQRFVEFYDVRDAAKALDRLNGEEICGRQVVIEFSRPGGLRNKFMSSRQPQLPFQPLQPPLSLSPPMRQSVSLMKDKNKNVSPNNGVVAVKDSMRSLCITDDDNRTRGMQSETKSKNVANWGMKRQMRNTELSQFLISEETMKDPSCRDPRTTLMIKNIPNKYSQKMLTNMLDNHCIHINEAITEESDKHESHHQPFSSYDFVYLPMDFNNKCNVGYGFVNMTSPEAAWRFYKAFHLQRWEVFNSQKICQVTYARVQGLEDLKEHFKSSKFPCEAEVYLPVVFSPPRDGKQLTEAVSININGFTRLDHSHLEPNDGEDHYVSGSCSGSDHDNSQEDGFSGSSIDGGRSISG
ncbi:unnamed protein product [Microthlaspi erraticum]|uniref:RRM domain-containing protein n=1 Tax=Microthlaspi erraticum TaxID=1685480 RepID=A0A6D2K9Q0_9BRAS|nr:unnamed protein product [Microthlaspi erraticum]